MKKLQKKILIILLILCLFNNIFLLNTKAYEIQIIGKNANLEKSLSRLEIFNYVWNTLLKDIPSSYKYINLNYKWIDKNTEIYKNLQKIVYTDAILNAKSNLELKSNLKAYYFYLLIEKITWIDFITDENILSLKARDTNYLDLKIVNQIVNTTNNTPALSDSEKEKMEIFYDVYNTLLKDHYNSKDMDKNKLLYWAIWWLTKASNDNYTTFFEPIDYKDFTQDLSWEFEWIWTYIDMEVPWVLKVISPIKWSPADLSWILSWDIIKKVDWVEIDKTFSITKASSIIRWPAWTKVNLTILRWDKTIEITVTRWKITLKDVEYKVLNNKFFYIQTRMFWDNIANQFSLAIDELNKNKEINKIIIDLRNNPGWYLEQVNEMMSLLIEKWLAVSVLNNKWKEQINYSTWPVKVDLSKYQVFILANAWTASASEILIWTLKDYFPNIKIIGEKTYWKWSVQTIKTYLDGSSLKYTISKWYTWLSKTSIDLVWIKPDIEVKVEKDSDKTKDIQLDYILNNY